MQTSCTCGHPVEWHTIFQGCSYKSVQYDYPCSCPLKPSEVVEHLLEVARYEGAREGLTLLRDHLLRSSTGRGRSGAARSIDAFIEENYGASA